MIERNILQGAPNFRDLGGMKTADGRHIKAHRLLRCGHLRDITVEDRERLTKEFHLKTVVDLRTTMEKAQKPDQSLPGVTYRHCPVFDHKAEGVTRETVVEEDPVLSALAIAKKMDGQAIERMTGLYSVLFEEQGIAAYREFFRIVLEQEEGAVLWHCTMGKDRCGTAAALLETALGIPYETVLADYLYTNERVLPLTEKTIEQARAFTDDEALFEQMRQMDSVHETFLQAAFQKAVELSGSLENFIEDKLGMTPEKLERLREMYLE